MRPVRVPLLCPVQEQRRGTRTCWIAGSGVGTADGRHIRRRVATHCNGRIVNLHALSPPNFFLRIGRVADNLPSKEDLRRLESGPVELARRWPKTNKWPAKPALSDDSTMVCVDLCITRFQRSSAHPDLRRPGVQQSRPNLFRHRTLPTDVLDGGRRKPISPHVSSPGIPREFTRHTGLIPTLERGDSSPLSFSGRFAVGKVIHREKRSEKESDDKSSRVPQRDLDLRGWPGRFCGEGVASGAGLVAKSVRVAQP